jgi:hypothetical protein
MALENLDSIKFMIDYIIISYIMIEIFYILVEQISIILKKNNRKIKKIR